MNSSEQPEDLNQLAADYVLGTMSAQTRRAVEARLAADVVLQREVTMWEARLLPLTSLAEPVDPSPALWPRIADSVALGTLSARQTVAGWRAWWNSLNVWRGFAAGGYAVAAVLAAVLLQSAGQQTQPQYLVVLVAPQDKAPGWVVQAADDRSVSLIPLQRTDVPADRSLQFWTKADDWQGPVSLGLVAPGQTLRVPMDRLPPLQPNQLFELTLEPAQGSPLNRPTGPIQFIGRAVQVRS